MGKKAKKLAAPPRKARISIFVRDGIVKIVKASIDAEVNVVIYEEILEHGDPDTGDEIDPEEIEEDYNIKTKKLKCLGQGRLGKIGMYDFEENS